MFYLFSFTLGAVAFYFGQKAWANIKAKAQATKDAIENLSSQ